MGKPFCAVPLPPELQRELPAGTLVYNFDGEMVYRSKNPNLNQEPRTYSLMPVLAGFLPETLNDRDVSTRLQHAGLNVPPLSRYAVNPIGSGLLFGLSAFTPGKIDHVVAKITRVLNIQ